MTESKQELDANGDSTSNHGSGALTAVDTSKAEVESKGADYGGILPENEITGVPLVILHVSLCITTFLVGLDLNMIATAIPVITSQFDSIHDVGWYGAAFFIALCSTQPLCGTFFTQFPKKLVYILYLIVFEAGSLICALAPSSGALIGGRVISGLGASGILGGGLIVLTTVIPLHKRPIFTGTFNSVFIVASVVGPLIGGAFTQHVTWRWCFYINLPIGGAAGILIVLLFREKRSTTEDLPLDAKLKRVDLLGFILFAGSIVMLLLALQWGGNDYAWHSSPIIGLFVGFGITLTAFLIWQIHRGDQALIPPALFKNKNAALIITSSFFANGPLQTIIYWLPVWFQAVLGVSPVGSGIRYLPSVISDVLTSVIGAGLAQSLGIWNPFIILGEVMICLAGGLLSTIYPTISQGHWIGYQIFAGIGYSLVTTMAHLGAQASLPTHLVPLGATTILTIISTSCAIFLAIGQAVFNVRLVANLSGIVSTGVIEKITAAYSKAITQIFYIPAGAPVVAFSIVIWCSWTKMKQDPKPADAEATVKAEQIQGKESTEIVKTAEKEDATDS